jgi:uncharacterized protein YuzE
MKVSYFEDTDTRYIEFRDSDTAESKDLDENAILDVAASGNVCAITFEHASQQTDVRHLIVEGIAASAESFGRTVFTLRRLFHFVATPTSGLAGC